ncbi:hypothetical protein GCM10023197_24960 [Gordonia humi]
MFQAGWPPGMGPEGSVIRLGPDANASDGAMVVNLLIRKMMGLTGAYFKPRDGGPVGSDPAAAAEKKERAHT